jgi:hypothetical protein
MADREQAIQDFLRSNDIEEKLGQALAAVLSRNPTAILVFWEEENGYGALTVPHSRALAFGLANAAFDMLVEDEPDVDDGLGSDPDDVE